MRRILALSALLVLVGCKQHEEILYFSCLDAITKESSLFNDVLQINIDEGWMQFDDIRLEEDFVNDDFVQKISTKEVKTDDVGNKVRIEYEFYKITGAFQLKQTFIELPSWNNLDLRYVCTPTEPVMP